MKLDLIFRSNMVFAMNRPIRVFGSGTGVAKITFAGVTKTVEATENTWCVCFDPMDHGGPYTLVAELDGKTEILENVYVGKVILLAGQSNMQFKMHESSQKDDKYVENDKIRLYSTERPEQGDRFVPEDGWVLCSPDTAPDWSAIGYNVAVESYKRDGIAVGMITCYQGASVIQSWLPKGTLENIGIFIDDTEKHFDHFHERYGRWNGDGMLYEFIFYKIKPFDVSAVLWYQGESNTANEALYYKAALKELIRIWRGDLFHEDLAFVIVQLANNVKRGCAYWTMVQDAQMQVPDEVEHVRTVMCADVCEDTMIHPVTKDKLCLRINDALDSLGV